MGITLLMVLPVGDPVVWKDGMKLVFRVGEDTSGCGDCEHCPNQFCPPNATAMETDSESQRQLQDDLSRRYAEMEKDRMRRRLAHERKAVMHEILSEGIVGVVSAAPTTPDYSEYHLGAQGATCDATCTKLQLKCNPSIDMGDAYKVPVWVWVWMGVGVGVGGCGWVWDGWVWVGVVVIFVLFF
jgi:hypothetical protein